MAELENVDMNDFNLWPTPNPNTMQRVRDMFKGREPGGGGRGGLSPPTF